MSIADQLNQLNDIRLDIINAISGFGVPITSGDGFSVFASKIAEISSGGSGGSSAGNLVASGGNTGGFSSPTWADLNGTWTATGNTNDDCPIWSNTVSGTTYYLKRVITSESSHYWVICSSSTNVENGTEAFLLTATADAYCNSSSTTPTGLTFTINTTTGIRGKIAPTFAEASSSGGI